MKGYLSNQDKFLGYKQSVPIIHRKPQKDDDLPDVCKNERQIYKRNRGPNCKYDNVCPKKIEDRKHFVLRWMTDRFLDKRRNVDYKFRLSISEGINAYHETLDGIINLVGTTRSAVDNECDLGNGIFNLTRYGTFIGEGY